MPVIPIPTTTLRLSLSPELLPEPLSAEWSSTFDDVSTEAPPAFLSRPHLHAHTPLGNGPYDWRVQITSLELCIMLASMLTLLLILTWLVIIGLDVLLPRCRRQPGVPGSVLRYVRPKGDGLKDTSEMGPEEEGKTPSRRGSLSGQKDGADAEKAESMGEQLGLNEPRRRTGV